jgi:hypothetical protein
MTKAMKGSVRSKNIRAILNLCGTFVTAVPRTRHGASYRFARRSPFVRESAAAAAISFIHQDLGLIDAMTIPENIGLVRGYPRRTRRSGPRHRRHSVDRGRNDQAARTPRAAEFTRRGDRPEIGLGYDGHRIGSRSRVRRKSRCDSRYRSDLCRRHARRCRERGTGAGRRSTELCCEPRRLAQAKPRTFACARRCVILPITALNLLMRRRSAG